MDVTFWIIVVFFYYMLATLLPVDKIIGKIYPLFAIALLFMACLLYTSYTMMPRNIMDGQSDWNYRKVSKEEWCGGFQIGRAHVCTPVT